MILLADIGNTDVTFGYSDNGRIRQVLRIPTETGSHAAEQYGSALKTLSAEYQSPEGASICSVVPSAALSVQEAIKTSFSIEPVIVTHALRTGLSFDIDNAEGLGADRIANASAAHHLYKGNVIVVDCGTATTFCMVTEKAVYAGGAIMPGPALSAKALADRTAQLPAVALAKPSCVLGKSTEGNILSGVIVGHAGAVDRIISGIKQETASGCTVIATGGLYHVIEPYLTSIDTYNPVLTLEGLRLLYEMNA